MIHVRIKVAIFLSIVQNTIHLKKITLFAQKDFKVSNFLSDYFQNSKLSC